MNSNKKENISTLLKALAYFDVFEFPLTYNELFRYSNVKEESLFREELEFLLNSNLIYKVLEYYSLSPEESISNKRKEGEERAEKYTKQAFRKSALIAKFP